MLSIFQRFAPLLCLSLLIGFGVVWRAYYQKRHYGTAAIVLFASKHASRRESAAYFLGLTFVMVVNALGAALLESWNSLVPNLTFLTVTGLRFVGAGLMILATLLMVYAQLAMGKSWRIGIDDRERPGLVVDGIYQYSRNPIYLFLFLALCGFLLLLPNYAALFCLVVGIFAIHRQVQEEEKYLLATYGDEFIVYAQRVGRFVPYVGKWRGNSKPGKSG